MERVGHDARVERPDVGLTRDSLVAEGIPEVVADPEMLDEQAAVVALEMTLEWRGEPAGLLDRLGQQRDHRVPERVGSIDDRVAVGTELAIRADEPASRVDDGVVVVGDLGLEPRSVAFHEVCRVGRPQRGQEERQRVDAVLEDVARAIEVVDRRRDVAAAPRPDVERVGQRSVNPLAVPEPDQRRHRERQITRPEHVEVTRTGRERPTVPAGIDAGAHDRGSVTGMSRVAAELAPKTDPDVVDVGRHDSRRDPRGECHAETPGLMRDGFPMRPV